MQGENKKPSYFPGRSLVMTPSGLKAMQHIEAGDLVLTGSNKFVAVKNKKESLSQLLEIKGHGHPNFSVAKGQKILATDYKRKVNSSTGKAERKFRRPSWVSGENMKGMFWASPAYFIKTEPPIDLNEDITWLMGAYIGNGFVNHNKINFLTNYFRDEELRSRLNNLGIKLNKIQRGSIAEYYVIDDNLANLLRSTFDVGYGMKNIPFWIYGMDKKYRKSFFNGFVWGCGIFEGRYKITTNSKYIAIGMKLIAQTLGYSTALYYYNSKRNNKKKENWRIVAEINARSSTAIGNNRFGLVREVYEYKKPRRVYELELEEENTIIVDGLIVKI